MVLIIDSSSLFCLHFLFQTTKPLGNVFATIKLNTFLPLSSPEDYISPPETTDRSPRRATQEHFYVLWCLMYAPHLIYTRNPERRRREWEEFMILAKSRWEYSLKHTLWRRLAIDIWCVELHFIVQTECQILQNIFYNAHGNSQNGNPYGRTFVHALRGNVARICENG